MEELGQGAFGKVYKGTMKIPLPEKKSLKSTTAVAVKMLQGKLQSMGVARIFQRGGHTDSYRG